MPWKNSHEMNSPSQMIVPLVGKDSPAFTIC